MSCCIKYQNILCCHPLLVILLGVHFYCKSEPTLDVKIKNRNPHAGENELLIVNSETAQW